MKVSALCGSLRRSSYNQALLDTAIERGRSAGLEIVQAPVDDFGLSVKSARATLQRR